MTFTIHRDAATSFVVRVVSVNPTGIKLGDYKHGQVRGQF